MEFQRILARSIGLQVIILLSLVTTPARVQADAVYDWQRLAQVRSVAWVNPFFPGSVEHTAGYNEPHSDRLHSLRLTLQASMLRRLRNQSRFAVAPQSRIEQVLHNLHWTAADLFTDRGAVRGKAWPQPDRERISVVA